MRTTTTGQKRAPKLLALLVMVVTLAVGLMAWSVPAIAIEGEADATEEQSVTAPDSEDATTEDAEAADAEAEAEDTAPDNTVTLSEPMGGLPLMGNDYVWFGENLRLQGAGVRNDIIAAGRSVIIDNCQVVGAVRAAAQSITISDTSANQNITVAAQDIVIDDGQANAVAAACNTFSFSGSCQELTAFASDVFIDGTVEGDVNVGANNVIIGTNARIKGTLHVSAPQDPVMQRGAEVAEVEYTKTEEEAPAPDTNEVVVGLASSLVVFSAVISIIGALVVAVLAEWLFKRNTAAAAQMIRTRTGATIGTGVVGAFLAPLVIVILCVLVVTLPVAGILTLTLIAMTVAAKGFVGASVFKLAFPNLGRFKCALAGGAIMGVAGAIPILGTVVSAAAFMYFLGYVLQSIYLSLHTDAPAEATPIDPTTLAE